MKRASLAALSLALLAVAAFSAPSVPPVAGRLAVYRLQLPHGLKAQTPAKASLSGRLRGQGCSSVWQAGRYSWLIVDAPLSGKVTLSAEDGRTGVGEVAGVVTFRGQVYSGDGPVFGEGELSGTLQFKDGEGKPLPPAKVSISVREWEAPARGGCVEIDQAF